MTKIVHIGDLHLGIRFHKRNLIPDQAKVLFQIIDICKEQKAHLVIAGDIFDTVNPSIEAQELWFDFLNAFKALHQHLGLFAYIIAGNHDSAARLNLSAQFTADAGINIVPKNALIAQDTLPGDVRLVMVPFAKPASVESVTGIEVNSYDEAYKMILSAIKEDSITPGTVLVAHQSFEGCKMGESEFKPFMSDSISLDDVKQFPVVMAGHIHGYQQVGNVTYCGSLLPYAFGDEYYPNVSVWTFDKGAWAEERVPIRIEHKLKTIEGNLAHCLTIDAPDEYVKVHLIDCAYFDEALVKLEEHFPYLCAVTTDAADTWEADLNKEVAAFANFEEAMNAFCEHLEIPKFTGRNAELIQEALDAYQKTENS